MDFSPHVNFYRYQDFFIVDKNAVIKVGFNLLTW
jgi:hypothetical protein